MEFSEVDAYYVGLTDTCAAVKKWGLGPTIFQLACQLKTPQEAYIQEKANAVPLSEGVRFVLFSDDYLKNTRRQLYRWGSQQL